MKSQPSTKPLTLNKLPSYREIKGNHILLSPLDWGFGHTTRCATLVHHLINNGNTVVFAGNTQQRAFFSKEFPSIKTLHIEGYNIKLNSKRSTYWQILIQLPKCLLSILKEKRLVKRWHKTNRFDLIISDNRYGFYTKKTPSILLTHQTNPSVPFGRKFVQYTLRYWIQKFDQCWIPDTPNAMLSGSLSDHQLKIPVEFIGPLSRFELKQTVEHPTFDYLFIVSGPHPEPSLFLNKILKLIKDYPNESFAVVSTTEPQQSLPPNLSFFHSPSRIELQNLINTSTTIIGKCGYTSLMELYPILNRTVLIPTHGQFEQIYLEKRHQTQTKINNSNVLHKLLSR